MKASGAEAVADLPGRHPQRGQLAAADDAVLPPREVSDSDINAAIPGFDGLRAALWSLYDINADSGAGKSGCVALMRHVRSMITPRGGAAAGWHRIGAQSAQFRRTFTPPPRGTASRGTAAR